MPGERAPFVLGYGLFGLGVGALIFSFVYLFLARARIAEPQSTTWLFILLSMLLVPALVGAAVGASRARRETATAPY